MTFRGVGVKVKGHGCTTLYETALGFCDIMNQKQNKTNRMVQTGMKSKFLVE
jgi:hypothetical protein